MAVDLKLFRQYLNIDRFPALLGHSHGANIALAYSKCTHSNIARLMLIDHRLLSCDASATFACLREERKGRY
ncbi:hypothetical protein PAAG_00008 [Paracoccidioides lutzii Pb01]|uniref:AB hydrolase-1 domain-containing protein n=1 Tax=Paracoccidioides lutzii (strain ATCC MYA-826 / Pb01) TaxID=502779 RepID=C1GNB3_PARBA|nr:hypothetical protein PAAG_00008 [Paracoccidioides lutzii Pb01]EEH35685.1 hypothetical protein PAAG_00008 [Paracoccidioides lutzii Pb01]